MSNKVSDQSVVLVAKNGGSLLIEYDATRGREVLIILENGKRVSRLDMGSAGILEIRLVIEIEKIRSASEGMPLQEQIEGPKKCVDCRGSGGSGGQDGDDPFIACPTCKGKGYA